MPIPAALATPADDEPFSAEIEARFASLVTPEEKSDAAGAASSRRALEASVASSDYTEARALFAELVGNHVRPVRDFVIDLRWSDATVDWLPVCRPALASLGRAARPLGLDPLCAALDRFAAAIEAADAAASESGARTIGGAARDALLAGYEGLVREMPQAFALDLDRSKREGVIVRSLLLQVPEVNKILLDRMVAAGVSTLEALFLATSTDLAAATGMSTLQAGRIVARVRAYRDQVKATGTGAGRATERQRIATLASRLRDEHKAYERAAEGWSREAGDRKRDLRRARSQTLLDLQLELARLGEVDRVARIERLPFEAKLAELDAFLREAEDKFAPGL